MRAITRNHAGRNSFLGEKLQQKGFLTGLKLRKKRRRQHTGIRWWIGLELPVPSSNFLPDIAAWRLCFTNL